MPMHKIMTFEFDTADQPLVLIADDEPMARTLHATILKKEFRVEVVESGSDVLQVLDSLKPDLILLDIEMPGLDGYETCRRIREQGSLPIIVVTGHDTLESQLEAFEAGANDLIQKPVSADLLLRKAGLAIDTHQNYQRLLQEKNSLQSMAMNFLSSVGETGSLLNFLRTSIQCRSYIELAHRLSEAMQNLGMQCYGVIRTATGNQYFRSEGEPSPLEKSVLSQVASMGRVFQFKSQLVVNYDHVSMIATNAPIHSDEETGKFRDNLTILAEAAESLVENVEMRQASVQRAEQLQVAMIGASAAVESLRHEHRLMMTDTRLLLQELVDKVEGSFSWLGATTDQENAINDLMNESVQNILAMLSTRGQFEAEFSALLGALHGTTGSSDDIELF